MVHIAHPLSHVLTHLQLEGMPESTVTSVTAFACQLLGVGGTMGSDSLLIETYEMIDAQIINISIVSHALTGEILAEIESVGTNNLRKLENGKVVLQVEPFVDAMLL